MKTIEIISLDFLYITVVTVFIYHLLAPRRQIIWLLLVSYFFYASWGWQLPILLIVLTSINFLGGRLLEISRSTRLYSFFIFINVGSLISLKFLTGPYGARFMEEIVSRREFTNILLPIGFSFYVLQVISYLTDIYRGQQKAEGNFIVFALYMAYFPKMLAGPIERAKTFLPQLKQLRVVDKSAFESGIYFILLGLLRKIVIADHLYRLRPNDIFIHPENFTSFEQLVWLILFGFTLYNDFAGYTNIVRGVSEFLGIHLSANFRQPFLATSFSDFWMRWHITLSEWLRDYVFYPVRRRLLSHSANRWLALLAPPLITMLASGFWHGVSLVMLLWGGIHGMYLILEQVLQQRRWFPSAGWKTLAYRIFVFAGVALAWIPFNTPGARSAGRFLVGLIGADMAKFNFYIIPDIAFLVLLSAWLDMQEQRHGTSAFLSKWKPTAQAWVTAVIIVLVGLFISAGKDLSGFIYQGY